MADPAIGFIGLGDMGMPMVRRLRGAGHTVNIWGRTPARLAPALEAGAVPFDSAAALAAACDIVFTCITDTDAVEEVVFGPDGIAEAAAGDKLLVDHSTIHPLRSRAMAEQMRAETGMGWVDAPVSGGPGGAADGTLIVMAGGDAGDLARATPVMEAYARQITHMGPAGAGQASKVCNQMLIGAEVAALAEAMKFAANFGVAASRLPDCLAGGWADSTVLQNHGRRMAAADYEGAGKASQMLKDMNIACDMGRVTGTAMPVASLVTALYALLVAQGHDDKGQIGPMWLYAEEPL